MWYGEQRVYLCTSTVTIGGDPQKGIGATAGSQGVPALSLLAV